MKKLIFVCLFVGTFSSGSLWANGPSVLGAWKLKTIEKITTEGKAEPWCSRPNGTLMYTRDGYVSAAINCADGKMLFYSGKYSIEKDVVTHIVQNASDMAMVGKILKRTIKVLTHAELELLGAASSGNGQVNVKWKRAP